MLVNVTNASSTLPVYVSSFALSLDPSETVSAKRTMAQIDSDLNLRALIAAGLVTVTFTAETGDEIAGEPLGSDVVGEMLVLHKAYTALVTGAADDVTVMAVTPFEMRILDVQQVTTTAVGASTVTLRTAAAGAGTDLSGALASAATGRAASVKASTDVVAKGGALFLRRSDRAVAGEIIITVLRTA